MATLLGSWRASGARAGAADLAAGVRLLVLDGKLPPGTRLPAERELAGALGASRTMISSALDRLREAGIVSSRQGAGSWITVPRCGGQPDGPSEFAVSAAPGEIDLARAAPAAVAGLGAAIESAQLRLAAELCDHGYVEHGLPELREQIAQRYAARGLPTTPDQIVVTNGAHNAFALVLRLFTSPGDRVVVEQPTYPNALDAVRLSNAIPVGVSMREGGWSLPGIESALRASAPRLAYFVVDFQNPTGLRMDAEDRRRLASVLRRAEVPAVVDETVVELDLDGDPLDGPPPLAAFAGEWAITVGSASKSHWGGLRLGWIRASVGVVRRLLSTRNALDLGSPVLEQIVLAELLARGDEPVRTRRAELTANRDALIDALAEHCPQWTFRRPGGGLALWCELPEPVSTRLAVAAREQGVRLAPGSRFGVHGGFESRLRLPFALSADVLLDVVPKIAEAAKTIRMRASRREIGEPISVV
ncbi:GntR family transcriptional regulator [Herbihabitans rhizosphaerae]|uniref:GntR family transcriptional regulator n=1 Tax=Herbihabitans rhizosphaerae TaxID=1872711 RepID=A0A4Q7L8C8_9PSEU|nr:PLP-dependent aminotransferase family protein [Herbihabitans rhizosphaerae]RZS44652.1 GntR family transcriptional regulator [Herbihabitans rhizosphaerae]